MPESVACPTCRRQTPWQGNPFRPFCSRRCKITDLGAWASESFRVPGESVEDSEDESRDDDS